MHYSVRNIDLPLFRRLCGVGTDRCVPLGPGESDTKLDSIAALNLYVMHGGADVRGHTCTGDLPVRPRGRWAGVCGHAQY